MNEISDHIKRLLDIASDGISNCAPISNHVFGQHRESGLQLQAMLELKNGFYAFESALHVYPDCDQGGVLDLARWNSPTLWREAYGSDLDGYLFFAQDAFGQQFGIRGGEVYFVDTETGEAEHFASSIDGWAQEILADYEVHTGYPLMHEWQSQHGPIPNGHRLIPKIPFVCGGEYSIQNLYAGDIVKALHFMADLAGQIKDLPDGAEIRFTVEE